MTEKEISIINQYIDSLHIKSLKDRKNLKKEGEVLSRQVNTLILSIKQEREKLLLLSKEGFGNNSSKNKTQYIPSKKALDKIQMVIQSMNRGINLDMSNILRRITKAYPNDDLPEIDLSNITNKDVVIKNDTIDLSKLVFNENIEVDSKALLKFLSDYVWETPNYKEDLLSLIELFGLDITNVATTKIQGLDKLVVEALNVEMADIPITKTLKVPTFIDIKTEQYWDKLSNEYKSLEKYDIIELLTEMSLYNNSVYRTIPTTDKTKKYFGNENSLLDMPKDAKQYNSNLYDLLESVSQSYDSQYNTKTGEINYNKDSNSHSIVKYVEAKKIIELKQQKQQKVERTHPFHQFHNVKRSGLNERKTIKVPTIQKKVIKNTVNVKNIHIEDEYVYVTTYKNITVSSSWNTEIEVSELHASSPFKSGATTSFVNQLRNIFSNHKSSEISEFLKKDTKSVLKNSNSYFSVNNNIKEKSISTQDKGYVLTVTTSKSGLPNAPYINKVIRIGPYESYINTIQKKFSNTAITSWPVRERNNYDFTSVRSLLRMGPNWSPNMYNAMFTVSQVGSKGHAIDIPFYDMSSTTGPSNTLDRNSSNESSKENKKVADLWYIRLSGINIPTPSFEPYTVNFMGRTIQKLGNKVIESHKMTLSLELDNNMTLLKHFNLLSGIHGYSIESLEKTDFKSISESVNMNSYSKGMYIPYSSFPPIFKSSDTQINLEVVYNDFRKESSPYNLLARGLNGIATYTTPLGIDGVLGDKDDYKQFTIEGIRFLGVSGELKFERDHSNKITIDIPITFKRILYNTIESSL